MILCKFFLNYFGIFFCVIQLKLKSSPKGEGFPTSPIGTINGLVHLSMKQSPDIQVQAWQNSKISYYAIEYYSSGESILCEYDSKEIWSEILIALEDNLII